MDIIRAETLCESVKLLADLVDCVADAAEAQDIDKMTRLAYHLQEVAAEVIKEFGKGGEAA